MLKIIRRAGLEPWERVFQNLRASRQTELSQHFPAHVVCGWMGNSEAVAGEHYLHTTDADFQKATHNQTHSGAEMSEIEGTAGPLLSPETQTPRHFRGVHSLSIPCAANGLPDQDSNLDKQNQNLLCYRYTIGYRKRGGSLVQCAGATQEGQRGISNVANCLHANCVMPGIAVFGSST